MRKLQESNDPQFPFPEYAPEVFRLPGGLPGVVWFLIVSELSSYEQRLSRSWSKSFRRLNLNFPDAQLQRVIRNLGYHIDPTFLKFSSLFEFYPECEKRAAAHVSRLLSSLHRLQQNFLRNNFGYYHHNLFQSIAGLLFPEASALGYTQKSLGIIHSRITKKSNAKIHPLLISFLIDLLYLTVLREMRVTAQDCNQIISIIQSQESFTPQQVVRLHLVEAVCILKNTKLSDEEQWLQLMTLLELPEQMWERFNEIKAQILSSHFYFCADLSSLKSFITPPVERPVLLARKFLPEKSLEEFYQSVFVSTRLKKRIDNLPKSLAVAIAEFPVVAELVIRSRGNQHLFEVLFSRPAMQEYLCHPYLRSGARVGKTRRPLWLINYLFVPEVLSEEDRNYLNRWRLYELPSDIFINNYTQGELRPLEKSFDIHALLLRQGLERAIITDIAKRNYSKAAIEFVLERQNPFELNLDVIEFFNNDEENNLEEFINSDLRKTLDALGIRSLYFLGWVLQNFVFLKTVHETNPQFFKATLEQLFDTCKLKFTAKGLPVAIPVSITYFELLRKAFAKLLGKEFCTAIFDPDLALLPTILQRDPLEILLVITRVSNRQEGVRHFINFFNNKGTFSKFSPDCDWQHLILCGLADPEKMLFTKFKDKYKYKGTHYLHWLSRLTHKDLFLKLFLAAPEAGEMSLAKPLKLFPAKFADTAIAISQEGYLIDQKGSELFQMVEIFAKAEILDKPEDCCRLLDNFGMLSLLELFEKNKAQVQAEIQQRLKRVRANQLLPVSINHEPSELGWIPAYLQHLGVDWWFNEMQYREKPVMFWVQQPAYQELFFRLLSGSILDGSNPILPMILAIFVRHDLFDRPDFCLLLLGEMGVFSILDLDNAMFPLHLFGKVDLDVSRKEIRRIKELFQVDLCNYMRNNIEVIKANLGIPSEDAVNPEASFEDKENCDFQGEPIEDLFLEPPLLKKPQKRDRQEDSAAKLPESREKVPHYQAESQVTLFRMGEPMPIDELQNSFDDLEDPFTQGFGI